jgi:rod shape-determining protein MreD
MAARGWSYATLIVLLVLAHFVLRLAIGLGWGTPDLLTVAALLAARRSGGARAAGVGLVLGVLDDGLTINSYGTAAVALATVSFLGARSRDLFEGDSLLFLVVYLFIGKWLRDAIVYLLDRNPSSVEPIAELFMAMPVAAAVAAGAGMVAMILYRAATGERS